MVKVLIISMALLIIAAPMATALTAEEAEHFLQGVYNPNVDNIIPDLPLVKNVFAGQVIHIIITKQNGNIEFDATTDPNGYITHLEREAPEEPTLRLKSDEETIETIINSDNPIKETQEALLNGKITYEGVTIGNKIQVAIINLVQWAAQLFGAV